MPPPWPALTGRRKFALACTAALGAAAAVLDLGGFHAQEHADAIVPVLVSLQRWTPFYWDQERYGMLVPLLAIPVRDPLWNLLLQRGVLVLAGLAAVVLLARHALAGREWRLAGLLSVALLLVLAPAPWAFEFLGDQPYGLSLALGLAGLACAEEHRSWARLGAGFVLVVAAHWVNAATGLLLLPLAAARAAVDALEGAPRAGLRTRLAVDGGLLAVGLAAGQGMIALYPVLSGNRLRLDVSPLPLHALPAAWGALLARTVEGAGPRWLGALAAAAALGLALPWGPAGEGGRRGGRGPALLRALALVAAGAAYLLVTGSLAWVAENAYHWRYAAPSLLLVHLAAVSLLAEPLARVRRGRRAVLAAALATVPLAALLVGGPPSLTRVRAELDGVAGRWTADLRAARCDLVAGDYWSVWPAVWHVAWTNARQGGAPVYGITHRATPTLVFWKDRPRAALRICRVVGKERDANRWLRDFRLWPVVPLERLETIDVVALEKPAPPVSDAGAERETRPP